MRELETLDLKGRCELVADVMQDVTKRSFSKGERKQLIRALHKSPGAVMEMCRAEDLKAVATPLYDIQRYFAWSSSALYDVQLVDVGGEERGVRVVKASDLRRVEMIHSRGRVDIVPSEGTRLVTSAGHSCHPPDGVDQLHTFVGETIYGHKSWTDIMRLRNQRLRNALIIAAEAIGKVFEHVAAETNGTVYLTDGSIDFGPSTLTVDWTYLEHSWWKEFSAVVTTIVGSLPSASSRDFAQWGLKMQLASGAQTFFSGNNPNGPLTQPDSRFAKVAIALLEDGWDIRPSFVAITDPKYLDRALPPIKDYVTNYMKSNMWRINGPSISYGPDGEIEYGTDGIAPLPEHLIEFERTLALLHETKAGARANALGAAGLKKCPDCAEEVKVEARKCRFCGYRFAEEPAQ